MNLIEKFYALIYAGEEDAPPAGLGTRGPYDTYNEAAREITTASEESPDFLYGVIEKRFVRS